MKERKQRSYDKDTLTALQAQRLAQEIAFGPVVFQVSRLMLKKGVLLLLEKHPEGLSLDYISRKCHLSVYAAQVLLESSLTIGTVICQDGLYKIAKTGCFLLNDPMVKVNMDFNQDVNYSGLYYLEEALKEGKPAGLKTFGNWPTIYEGLSQLPEQAQKSWFAFDHYYSDCSFAEALKIVFSHHPHTLLDVGGNTGRWALQCVGYDPDVQVTIMDLPQQLEMMRKQVDGKPGADRIHGIGCDLLNESTVFPHNFDAVWMSQFLDCFSETQVISILTRAAESMTDSSCLYIMETCWDRQQYETASYCLTQISLYFTAMANGNSKMFNSADLLRYIDTAGLSVEQIYDSFGVGHSLFQCRKK